MAVQAHPLPEKDRWQEILQIWLDHQWLFFLAGILVGLFFTPLILQLQADGMSFLQNVAPEVVGIVVTVGLIERFQRHHDMQERRIELILQMGSPDNGFAVEAVRILRHKGWLEGKHGLQGADLVGANLRGAILYKANLQGAKLYQANLQGARLAAANLQQAKMHDTHLKMAILFDAYLQGADLRFADLQQARLSGANLQGANLHYANLEGAFLQETQLNGNTILPDGSRWMPDTDLTRFTDPKHPNFWRPEHDSIGLLGYPSWYK